MGKSKTARAKAAQESFEPPSTPRQEAKGDEEVDEFEFGGGGGRNSSPDPTKVSTNDLSPEVMHILNFFGGITIDAEVGTYDNVPSSEYSRFFKNQTHGPLNEEKVNKWCELVGITPTSIPADILKAITSFVKDNQIQAGQPMNVNWHCVGSVLDFLNVKGLLPPHAAFSLNCIPNFQFQPATYRSAAFFNPKDTSSIGPTATTTLLPVRADQEIPTSVYSQLYTSMKPVLDGIPEGKLPFPKETLKATHQWSNDDFYIFCFIVLILKYVSNKDIWGNAANCQAREALGQLNTIDSAGVLPLDFSIYPSAMNAHMNNIGLYTSAASCAYLLYVDWLFPK